MPNEKRIYVSIDRKRQEAVYYLPSAHRCSDNANRCHYEDGRGILRCSVREAEASTQRSADHDEYLASLAAVA